MQNTAGRVRAHSSTTAPVSTIPPSDSSALASQHGFGNSNTAFGKSALRFNTSSDNTAVGLAALGYNSSGDINTATGSQALLRNTTGYANTATGFGALGSNTTGAQNAATGWGALGDNTTGSLNTATGVGALSGNNNRRLQHGHWCRSALWQHNRCHKTRLIVFGRSMSTQPATTTRPPGLMRSCLNTTGDNNTANGFEALFNNTTGSYNTAIGFNALFSNTTGGNNTADGILGSLWQHNRH